MSDDKSKPPLLPENFFDLDKKSKKAQEDELDKEMREFEKEMEALEAESEDYMKEQFEKLQGERNIDELNQQIEQWKRIVDLEKRAEQLKNKPIQQSATKKFKPNNPDNSEKKKSGDIDLATTEDFDDGTDPDDPNLEASLLDWRSKGL